MAKDRKIGTGATKLVIPSVARDLGGRRRVARSSSHLTPRSLAALKIQKQPQRRRERRVTQRSLWHLCVAQRSLRLCGCFSFFYHGGRPQAGAASARDESKIVTANA